jgi:integrase
MMPAVARYGVYLHILWLSVAWYWLMTVAVGSLYGSLMILLLAVRLRSSAAKASRPHSGSCVASATSGLRSGHCGSRGPRPATTGHGGRLFPADIWSVIRRLGKAAGLPADLVSHLGPHALRHAYATLALDSGVSLRDLQDAMGHSDPRTTRRYDRARYSLDRSPGYALAGYLTAAGTGSELGDQRVTII